MNYTKVILHASQYCVYVETDVGGETVIEKNDAVNKVVIIFQATNSMYNVYK